jgi:glucosamine kinase
MAVAIRDNNVFDPQTFLCVDPVRLREGALVKAHSLLLGVDGGGTRCRARLCATSGETLGEAVAGPANIRFGLEESMAAVLEAAQQCLEQAGLSTRDLKRITACLALAGASEPTHLAAAQGWKHPFARTTVTTDAHAACVGAHRGEDGGVVIVGTGTVGWAVLGGRHHRVGGWGLPISDEGSGAWLGCEALRRVLWAHDGRIAWSDLTRTLFRQFQCDPHAIVRWSATAAPRDFGVLAPRVVEYAKRKDPVATELMQLAAVHIDALAARLVAAGAKRLALTGGLAPHITPWLSQETQARLVPAAGDALDGALTLARAAAEQRAT